MNPFEVHIFVLGNRKSSSLLYPVRQLNHIRRVDAEEDVQDFGMLGPGFDSLQVIILLLGAERALHRPHSGKLPADKVTLPLLLTERTSSLHERRLNTFLFAVVPVLSSGVSCITAYLLCFTPEQPLVHLDAVDQPRALIEGVE